MPSVFCSACLGGFGLSRVLRFRVDSQLKVNLTCQVLSFLACGTRVTWSVFVAHGSSQACCDGILKHEPELEPLQLEDESRHNIMLEPGPGQIMMTFPMRHESYPNMAWS